MSLNSKKDLRIRKVEKALKNNLKKRKIFRDKMNREEKKKK